MSGWQPIETAPKDGTDILVFSPESGEMFVAYYKRGEWFFAVNNTLSCVSHWRDLPEPPK